MGFVAEEPLKTRVRVLVFCAIGWVAPAISGRSNGRINEERLRQAPATSFGKGCDVCISFPSFVLYAFFVAKGRNFWVGWVNASMGPGAGSHRRRVRATTTSDRCDMRC